MYPDVTWFRGSRGHVRSHVPLRMLWCHVRCHVTSGISEFGDLGGQQTIEMRACTYRSTKTMAESYLAAQGRALRSPESRSHSEETQRSVFTRRTSLKPVQRDDRVYIHREGVTTSHTQLRYESEGIGGSQSVQRVTASHDESAGVKGSRAGAGPTITESRWGHAMGKGRKKEGDDES